MTSLIDSLAASGEATLVIDIGCAYTKYGFAGFASPVQVVPSAACDSDDETRFKHDGRLAQLIRSIYSQYRNANGRDRRVVVVESIVTPTRMRRFLVDVFLKQLRALSIAFIPSHLSATYTLGRSTALVLDVGYKEAQIVPIAEGVPLAIQFDSVPCASEAVHRQIQCLLEQHAYITHDGKRQPFNRTAIKLSEEILEDIKVRCCFVSPLARARAYAKGASTAFKPATPIDYPSSIDAIIHIPGIVQEFACEVLFDDDIDGKSMATLLLDALLQAPIDLRRQLAENILVIGGTAMLPGFLHRLHAELLSLLDAPPYAYRLAIKEFQFHSPPAPLNYAAWLGGSMFGAQGTLEAYSVTQKKYLEDGIVPDWFMLEYLFNDRLFVTYTCPFFWFVGAALVLVFEVILDVKAPYGRYNTSNSGIPVKLAWILQELPSFVVPCYLIYHHGSTVSLTKLVIVGFYLIHYFQRVFVYPLLIRGGKHSSYLTTILAFIFCSINAYAIAKEILVYHTYPTGHLFSPRFLVGAVMFFAGFLLNLQSDAILRNLRKDDNDRGYKIPRGGLFEYVSGANFLAESIEWTGYALCAWTLPALAFAVFTWANTAFGRGLHHHQFYLEKFKDEYPKNRKAIIPFLL